MSKNGFLLTISSYILIIGFIFIPWVINIIKICHLQILLSNEGVIRIIGVFIAPIGWVLGWVGSF